MLNLITSAALAHFTMAIIAFTGSSSQIKSLEHKSCVEQVEFAALVRNHNIKYKNQLHKKIDLNLLYLVDSKLRTDLANCSHKEEERQDGKRFVRHSRLLSHLNNQLLENSPQA